MIQSPYDIGQTIRNVRKNLGLTQNDLALAAGTGLRFIIDLEKGKVTCQIGKVMQTLEVLGIKLDLIISEHSDE